MGCGLIAHTKGGNLVNLEGDPDHPINQGSLCSKGQAVREIILSPRRLKTVHYRAPGADPLGRKALEWAVQTLAQRLKATRDRALHRQDPRRGDGEPYRSHGLLRRLPI